MCAERLKAPGNERERFVKGRNERHAAGSLGTLVLGMHLEVPPFLLSFQSVQGCFLQQSLSSKLPSPSWPQEMAQNYLTTKQEAEYQLIHWLPLHWSPLNFYVGPQLHHFAQSGLWCRLSKEWVWTLSYCSRSGKPWSIPGFHMAIITCMADDSECLWSLGFLSASWRCYRYAVRMLWGPERKCCFFFFFQKDQSTTPAQVALKVPCIYIHSQRVVMRSNSRFYFCAA